MHNMYLDASLLVQAELVRQSMHVVQHEGIRIADALPELDPLQASHPQLETEEVYFPKSANKLRAFYIQISNVIRQNSNERN